MVPIPILVPIVSSSWNRTTGFESQTQPVFLLLLFSPQALECSYSLVIDQNTNTTLITKRNKLSVIFYPMSVHPNKLVTVSSRLS